VGVEPTRVNGDDGHGGLRQATGHQIWRNPPTPPPPWCSSPSQIRSHDDDSLYRLFLSAFPSPAPATVTRRCGSGRRPVTATRGRSSGRRDNAAAGGGRATRRHDSGRRLVRPLPLLPSLPLPCQVGAADVGTTVVPYHSHPLFSTILSLCLRI
jgi:hypothetical protein